MTSKNVWDLVERILLQALQKITRIAWMFAMVLESHAQKLSLTAVSEEDTLKRTIVSRHVCCQKLAPLNLEFQLVIIATHNVKVEHSSKVSQIQLNNINGIMVAIPIVLRPRMEIESVQNFM